MRATWPVIQTIGVESICASAIPVTRFVAPGPEVAIATPTLPVLANLEQHELRPAHVSQLARD